MVIKCYQLVTDGHGWLLSIITGYGWLLSVINGYGWLQMVMDGVSMVMDDGYAERYHWLLL